MKTGLSLVELAKRIEENAGAKKDMVVDTRVARMEPSTNGGAQLVLNDKINLEVNRIAHQQIATHTDIGDRYYKRMLENSPQLLSENVNHWLRWGHSKRLIRTINGTARAFLSDSYRPLDYEDLAEAVLPVLMDMNLIIMSCEITERRMYIKAVDSTIQRDVPYGKSIGDGSHAFFDTCSPAIVISNSEVGCGALKVESGVFTKVCTNLATFAKDGMRKRHLGAKHELTESLTHLLSDEAKKATDKAVWLQVRDVVKGAFDEARFDSRVKQIANMTTDKIEGDPVEMIQLANKRFGLTEGEGKSILRHLIEGGELTRYGLFNAVTRTAEDLPDYDRATEFEQLGGKIVELPRDWWQELARAA